MQHIQNISDISNAYDGYIIDLWGVIHDGLELYPGVIDTLKHMRAHKKSILFLSNAPRRAAVAEAKLRDFGITPDLHDGVVTSGEFTFLTLQAEGAVNGGTQYRFLGPERDRDVLANSAYTETSTCADASFLLNVGFDDDDLELSNYMPLLEDALAHSLPMICANPDHYVVRLNGDPFPCAGLFADAYAERGGDVRYFGKPYEAIYAHCLKQLTHIDTQRILAIGDNLDTDILGGNRAGLDTLLVTGGVLKTKLGLDEGTLPDNAQLAPELKAAGATPSYMVAAFA